jgi:hypothetical protein
MRRAIRKEADAYSRGVPGAGSAGPVRIQLQSPSAAAQQATTSGRGGPASQHSYKAMRLSDLPSRLRRELDVFIEMSQDTGVNLLRVNVFTTTLKDATVEVGGTVV